MCVDHCLHKYLFPSENQVPMMLGIPGTNCFLLLKRLINIVHGKLILVLVET